jgi:type 1 glutamine amidotransferase
MIQFFPRRACATQLTLASLVVAALAVHGHAADEAAKGPSAAADAVAGERGASTKKILLVTGEDYPGHKWRETTPVLRSQLEKDKRFVVEVVDDLTFLRKDRLHDHDVVVMHFKNYDPKVPGPDGWKNLDRFVRDGGGLVLVHFACGAFQEWPEFVKLAGRVWNPKLRGHDPYGKFRVEIVDPKHPVSKGLKSFETVDELYTCLDGDTPIHVIATSVSKVDGKTYPMAFVLACGKGRVFHCPLGHDVKALSVPDVGELFRRGCAWSACLEPVVPAP